MCNPHARSGADIQYQTLMLICAKKLVRKIRIAHSITEAATSFDNNKSVIRSKFIANF